MPHVTAETRTFEAEAALALGSLVKLGSAIGAEGVGLVDVCGSGEEPIGTAVKATAAGELVAVRLLGGGLGTHTVIAGGAVAALAALYSAAAGEVTTTPAGSIIGYAAEAAAAQGELIELIKRGVV
jgi:hypothetical protein